LPFKQKGNSTNSDATIIADDKSIDDFNALFVRQRAEYSKAPDAIVNMPVTTYRRSFWDLPDRQYWPH
jgi:hypothetical protein